MSSVFYHCRTEVLKRAKSPDQISTNFITATADSMRLTGDISANDTHAQHLLDFQQQQHQPTMAHQSADWSPRMAKSQTHDHTHIDRSRSSASSARLIHQPINNQSTRHNGPPSMHMGPPSIGSLISRTPSPSLCAGGDGRLDALASIAQQQQLQHLSAAMSWQKSNTSSPPSILSSSPPCYSMMQMAGDPPQRDALYHSLSILLTNDLSPRQF
jgi:hypothetical protein